MDKKSYKLGEAPWEIGNNAPKSFQAGQAPWEIQKEEVGGFKSFISDTTRAFLKVPTTVAAGVATGVARLIGGKDAALKAQQESLKGLDYGYFGNVKPIGAGAFEQYKAGDISGGKFAVKAGLDLAGTAAELGSYAIGGTGTVGAVKTGLKGLVTQGAKELAKTGAKSGAAFSFGQSLQDAESSPMETAYNTIIGTGVGAVGGGILGAATPLATKGVGFVRGLTKVSELENKLANGYKKIFNPTARQIKADTRFGGDSFKFLAQEMPDVPLNVNSAGRIEADDAINMAKMKYSAEATAFKSIIRNSGKYVDIDGVISSAKRAAKEEFDGTDLLKAEKQIDDEVNAYLANNPQDINVTASGKRFVTISRADDIKSYSWARGKGWGSPDAEVWSDTNNLIGHSFKDAIEKELPNAPIKEMNRRLGQWKNAIDMLERRNGQVSGSGGKLSKYIIKSVGTSIGATAGGGDSVGGAVGGAGAGFMTASALAAIMANPKVRLFAVRQLIQRLSKAGRRDLIKEAEQILQEQSTKYMLPAAGKSSYVETPIILPEKMKTGATGREVELGLNEVKGMNQNRTPSLSSTQSNTAVATNPNTIVPSSSMQETVPQNKNTTTKIVDNGVQKAAGGIAGIEIKKDDNGKTTIKFNPEKAIAGIVGMAAYNKIPAKLKQDVIDTFSILKKLSPKDFINKRGKLNIEAFGEVEDFFSKVKNGTVTKSDIDSVKEIHFMLKGNKEK